jgi:hypothetical protein
MACMAHEDQVTLETSMMREIQLAEMSKARGEPFYEREHAKRAELLGAALKLLLERG